MISNNKATFLIFSICIQELSKKSHPYRMASHIYPRCNSPDLPGSSSRSSNIRSSTSVVCTDKLSPPFWFLSISSSEKNRKYMLSIRFIMDCNLDSISMHWLWTYSKPCFLVSLFFYSLICFHIHLCFGI